MNAPAVCRGRLAVDPAQSAPKGRFVLRADAIRPYNPCGEPLHSTNSSIAQGFGRLVAAPTTAAAKPPTGRLIVDPYRARVRWCLSSKEPGGLGH